MDMNDLRRRDDDLPGCVQPLWPRFVDEVFLPRYREHTMGRLEQILRPQPPCDMDVLGRTTMDGILVDPELQTAW